MTTWGLCSDFMLQVDICFHIHLSTGYFQLLNIIFYFRITWMSHEYIFLSIVHGQRCNWEHGITNKMSSFFQRESLILCLKWMVSSAIRFSSQFGLLTGSEVESNLSFVYHHCNEPMTQCCGEKKKKLCKMLNETTYLQQDSITMQFPGSWKA